MEKEYLKEASIGMAIADALPVFCFCGTVALIGMSWRSPWFIAGGILCILAGVGKVLWKVVLAVSGKNRKLLYEQFRYLMGGGFLLCVLALVTGHKTIDFLMLRKYITWFPGNLFFSVGLLGMVLMIVLAAKMDMSTKKANWIEQWLNFFAQFFILLGVVIIWYVSDYYHASPEAIEYAESTETVAVAEIRGGLLFDGPGTEKALIFYPGAKVEYIAYAPLMRKIAEDGMDCFLLEMPYHIALFGSNKAGAVRKEYAYEQWYIGGHSLGGAMAASYASKHLEDLDGAILLAAYPIKSLRREGFRVLSVYGSEDKVLNLEQLQKGEQYMPADHTVCLIRGGNHALFGSYGEQAGDGTATISREEQWEKTAEAVRETIVR